MSRRLSSYILLVVLVGAVLDGGTLGFRSAWASCGDWLAENDPPAIPPRGMPAGEPSPVLELHFGAPFLRDDETADRGAHRAAPATRRCHPLDPTCQRQPQPPENPTPPTRDVEQVDGWFARPHRVDGLGRAQIGDPPAALPIDHPAGIFRPPRGGCA